MGCATSKQLEMQAKKLGWDAALKQNPLYNLSRSFSLPVRLSKHPELGNSQVHVVALTSSTYGALENMEIKKKNDADTTVSSRGKPEIHCDHNHVPSVVSNGNQQSMKAKVRSATQPLPESNQPDVIDVGKLMEDLEEEEGMNLKEGSMKKSKKIYGRCYSSSQANKTRKIEEKPCQTVDPFENMPADKIDSVKAISAAKDSSNVKDGSLSTVSQNRSIKGLLYGASLFSGSGLDSNEVIPEEKACEVAKVAASRNELLKTTSAVDAYSTPNRPNAADVESPRFDLEILNPAERIVFNQNRDEDCYYVENGGESNVSCELETPVMAKCLFPESEDEHPSGAMARKNKIPMAFEVLNKALSNKKFSSCKVSDIEIEEKKLNLNGLERFEMLCPPGGEDRVVLYFTSLRGIRKTYEDCNNLRMTLQSFNIKIDERDISMHSGFRRELNDLLEKPFPIPRLFIRGRYIGGVEEILRLNEDGLLEKLLEGFPVETSGMICEGCGDVRFIPCQNCSGSCKIISDMNKVVRCPECNENGLVRCPICY